MWLGELITERGVGNGMSLLIFTQVVADLPGLAVGGPAAPRAGGVFGIVLVDRPGRSSPPSSSSSRRSAASRCSTPSGWSGRKMFGGTSTYIPLKVNLAGVIPVIFASSLLYLPALVGAVQPEQRLRPGLAWVNDYLVERRPPALHGSRTSLLIIFFTYFYVSITFNPDEVADNMKKYGGFIPGIRAGKPTEEYLDYVLSRITLPGCALPRPHRADPARSPSPLIDANQNFPFGGTSHPDHGRRRARHGEADREPAPAAQLRRVPPVDATHHHGPARGRQGHPGQARSPSTSAIPAISTGDIFRANVAAGHRRSGVEAKRYMDAGEYVPDEVTNAMVRDRIDEPDADAGLPARRLPAHRSPRSRSSTA